MEHVIILGSGIVSALTSIPLVWLAIRHHHQMRALHDAHHDLHREVVGATTAHRPPQRPTPPVSPAVTPARRAAG
jgi:hypothetical protein